MELDKYIRVRHPGYPDQDNVLFKLLCVDGQLDGLYHGTVHTAAAIVAGNRFDGFVSTQSGRDGAPVARVAQGWHELLPHGNYYFHLPPSCTLTRTRLFPFPSLSSVPWYDRLFS